MVTHSLVLVPQSHSPKQLMQQIPEQSTILMFNGGNEQLNSSSNVDRTSPTSGGGGGLSLSDQQLKYRYSSSSLDSGRGSDSTKLSANSSSSGYSNRTSVHSVESMSSSSTTTSNSKESHMGLASTGIAADNAHFALQSNLQQQASLSSSSSISSSFCSSSSSSFSSSSTSNNLSHHNPPSSHFSSTSSSVDGTNCSPTAGSDCSASSGNGTGSSGKSNGSNAFLKKTLSSSMYPTSGYSIKNGPGMLSDANNKIKTLGPPSIAEMLLHGVSVIRLVCFLQ